MSASPASGGLSPVKADAADPDRRWVRVPPRRSAPFPSHDARPAGLQTFVKILLDVERPELCLSGRDEIGHSPLAQLLFLSLPLALWPAAVALVSIQDEMTCPRGVCVHSD
ncbi:unnamed protein product [Protopolystoma xenopodis]|uniref:Uncharacterized protein n=1 Tax=Protopolystoma xenopodis TaxID=117903 RepID=A0A3S5AXP2_9PLAT|nr:unnamed protein product [Protopolystoma xenopodis]